MNAIQRTTVSRRTRRGARRRRFDANAHREASLAGWEAAAAGWTRRQEAIRGLGAPVSAWMLDAVALQPGQRVLELAAGLGETGLLAAELVAPDGRGDRLRPGRGDARRRPRRAGELGLTNVEFQVLDAEWIDLPLASVDAVLCRWGYMLMADPPAALAETRRVLRPGARRAGRVGLASSTTPGRCCPTPGADRARPRIAARRRARPARSRSATTSACASCSRRPASPRSTCRRSTSSSATTRFDAFWETTLDISRAFHDAVLSRPEAEIAEIRAGLAARLEPFTAPDGTLAIPGRTLVASASA